MPSGSVVTVQYLGYPAMYNNESLSEAERGRPKADRARVGPKHADDADGADDAGDAYM